MRIILILAATVSLLPTTAFALQAGDAMSSWKSASPDDRANLVTELMRKAGRTGGRGKVIECLDAASGVSGHADLPIGRVAEACMSSDTMGDPV